LGFGSGALGFGLRIGNRLLARGFFGNRHTFCFCLGIAT
jgi:hypothetical protein